MSSIISATTHPQHSSRELDLLLAKKAAAIHKLVKRTRQDTVEIGQHLGEVRDAVTRGKWLTWLEAEFSWSDQTAYRFIHISELYRDPRLHTVWNLELPLGVLYKLAAPKAEEAREEIVRQIYAGEPVTEETVIAAVTGRRRKSPAELDPAQPDPAQPDPDPANPADPAESDAAASAEARKAAYAAMEETAAGPAGDAGEQVGDGDGVGDEHGDAVPGDPAIGADEHPASEIVNPADPAEHADSLRGIPADPGDLARSSDQDGVVVEHGPADDADVEEEQRPNDHGDEHGAAPGAEPKAGLKGGEPKAESLIAHWQRCPDELGALLDAAGPTTVLEAMPPNLGAALRARQPANLIIRLREMDSTAVAQVMLDAFGPDRFALIVEKVRTLRAPGGKRSGNKSDRSGQSGRGRKFKKSINIVPDGHDHSFRQ